MSVSRSGFFLVDLEPLMHKIAERSRAKIEAASKPSHCP